MIDKNSIGKPLVVNGPTPAEPEDNTNLGPKAKPASKKMLNEGEKGKGPVVKGDNKSPSEQVGQTVEQTSKLSDDPYNQGGKKKKPPKESRNPAEQGTKDTQTNQWVEAALDKWLKGK